MIIGIGIAVARNAPPVAEVERVKLDQASQSVKADRGGVDYMMATAAPQCH
jgi:hypothetical protein